MTTEVILQRLERVRRRGAGRWMAACPAHEDDSPSLSIRELDDSRVLVHCFAGCAVDDVVAAVGLKLQDLFPPHQRGDQRPADRHPFAAADVLAALADEALIVAVAAANLSQGVTLAEADRQRLLTAAERIQAARRVALGER